MRRALVNDLPAIVSLLADDALGTTRERPGLPLAPQYAAAFAEMSMQHGNELWVADIADEVVGCLQLTMIAGVSRLGTKRAQIEAVRVSGRHRGRQIGERLVRHAIERARAEGCSLVQLTTDRSRADAHRFYERLGFTASHVGMKLAL
jgi:ribosomal protein S18 acetylase RimI-like enzyme